MSDLCGEAHDGTFATGGPDSRPASSMDGGTQMMPTPNLPPPQPPPSASAAQAGGGPPQENSQPRQAPGHLPPSSPGVPDGTRRPEAAPQRQALGEFVTTSRTEDGVVADLLRFCRSRVPATELAVIFRAAGDGRFVPAGSLGFESGDLTGVAAKRGAGLVGIVAASGKPQLRDDLEADIAEPDVTRMLHVQTRVRSAIALPLVAGGFCVGVLVLYARRPGAFTMADVTVAGRACATAAPLLLNIRQLSDMEAQVKEARFIVEMARHLGPQGNLDQLMTYVLETAKGMVGGDIASVMLADPSTSELWIGRAEGLPAEVVETTKLALGCGIAGWVAENAKPLILRDFPLDGSNGKVKWAVSVPLRDNGKVVGVLNVGSTDRDKNVADDEMRLLLKLAAQAGVSIQNARALGAMQDLHFETMRALIGAIESADPYGRGHSENVARYAAAIARRIQLPPDQVKSIETAGMLHDVGKATLGEGLLRKGRPLTTIEQTAIQLHPAMSREILKDVPMLSEVIPAITHHHERFDGGGYGQGLKGEEIPLAARILAVADAFDAMTSERAYRAAMTADQAAAELMSGAGTQFDPRIVDVFCKMLRENPEFARKEPAGPSSPVSQPPQPSGGEQ